MPYKISYMNKGEIVFTSYFGILTANDVYAAFDDRFLDIKRIKKMKTIIADFADVTESYLEDLDVPRLAGMYRRAASYNPDPEVLVVGIMPTDLLFGIGRMWEGLIYKIPWKEKIVHTREEARVFLEENATDVHPQVIIPEVLPQWAYEAL